MFKYFVVCVLVLAVSAAPGYLQSGYGSYSGHESGLSGGIGGHESLLSSGYGGLESGLYGGHGSYGNDYGSDGGYGHGTPSATSYSFRVDHPTGSIPIVTSHVAPSHGISSGSDYGLGLGSYGSGLGYGSHGSYGHGYGHF